MFIDALLLQQCSPKINPIIAHAIVKTESSFNPFAIGVNSGSRLKRQPKSYGQALAVAQRLIANGKNIDLGLAQINSSNYRWLQLTPADALNPCSNLRAMQKIYLNCYKKAKYGRLGTRMQRAFSCYNTGSTTKGFRNGYVRKTTRNYNKYAKKLNFRKLSLKAKTVPIPKPQKAKVIGNGKAFSRPKKIVTVTKTTIPKTKQNFQPVAKATISIEESSKTLKHTRQITPVYASWDVFEDFAVFNQEINDEN